MDECNLNHYDIFAEDYDRHFGVLTRDIPFYIAEAQRADGPALELACGTGRVLVPVAKAGVEVTGLDGSPEMLDKLRAKLPGLPAEVRARVKLVEGDMRDFDLGEQFGLIYIPARSFLHLLTRDDQKAALACIHRCLRDGGRLALNFFNPLLKIIEPAAHRWQSYFDAPRQFIRANGNRVMVWNTRYYDTVTQVTEQYIIYEEIDPDGHVVNRRYLPLTLRWIYRFEFENLLELCGFEIEALYGTFDRQPFTDQQQELIWIARKA
ncbi:MAG: class I SAM-dependent methyltransferase [Anaerolineae bacterium]|nr:class I SAM-dependent methyltransferase [Anaerolineae bacterium]